MRFDQPWEMFVTVRYFECKDCKRQKKATLLERFIVRNDVVYSAGKKCPYCGGKMTAVTDLHDYIIN